MERVTKMTWLRVDHMKKNHKIPALAKAVRKGRAARQQEAAEALADISAIAGEIEQESNVEALVVAKGFLDCVAVINGEKASVIVKSEAELLPSQVAQITEIVYQQTGILPVNLNIIRK